MTLGELSTLRHGNLYAGHLPASAARLSDTRDYTVASLSIAIHIKVSLVGSVAEQKPPIVIDNCSNYARDLHRYMGLRWQQRLIHVGLD